MTQVVLQNVDVDFPIYELDCRSLKKSILSMSGNLIQKNGSQKVTIARALQDINLSLKDGDRVGIIGPNGAGKSTLLKTIAQIHEPTSGQMYLHGRVTPLLDIGLGMNDELTGHENIYLRGMFLGHSKKQIKSKVEDIAEFSGLGDYLKTPIRIYSQGMRLRLAFSISTAFLSEILLMDETIVVGDNQFIKKAQQRIAHSINNSSIFLIASHSIQIVKDFCNKAIFLQNGKLVYFGDIETAFSAYSNSEKFQ